MLFEASRPVSGREFCNRESELRRLLDDVDVLRAGGTRYVALLGLRKMGKTSLLHEFMRRAQHPDLACFLIDCWEKKPSPGVFFREYLAQTVDAFIRATGAGGVDWSLKANLVNQARTMSFLADLRKLGLTSLVSASDVLLGLQNGEISDALLEAVVDLPEMIAQEAGVHFTIIIDEFQELEDLNAFKATRESIGDIYAFFRARWQRHRKVNYILSGSRITAMREILTGERAPLFQHFDQLLIRPFDEIHALELLRSGTGAAGKRIDDALAKRIISIVGTCPFYLQVVGAELCRNEHIDEDALKTTMQRLLFDGDGRLYLYFQNLVNQVVGRSSSIERSLVALAQQPDRLSAVAKRLRVAPGTLGSWLQRCRDLVAVEDNVYRIADPCLALWLRTRSGEQPYLSTLVLGNEAEQSVARRMAAAGFEMVFQSRASRGAFDLLAVLGQAEVGVQVKKGNLPFYLSKDELHRMQHWAARMGWIPLFALVDEVVRFYQVGGLSATTAQGCRFDESTPVIENLLAFVSPASRDGRSIGDEGAS